MPRGWRDKIEKKVAARNADAMVVLGSQDLNNYKNNSSVSSTDYRMELGALRGSIDEIIKAHQHKRSIFNTTTSTSASTSASTSSTATSTTAATVATTIVPATVSAASTKETATATG